MNDRRRFIKGTAIALVVALAAGALSARAGADGALAGHVLLSSPPAPLEGARVLLSNARTGTAYASPATASDGSFAVTGIEPGTYRLAVQSGAGVYTVASTVAVPAGPARNVELALKEGEPATTTTQDAGTKHRKGSWWDNPLTASLVVVGAAVVLGLIVDQSSSSTTTPASPSNP